MGNLKNLYAFVGRSGIGKTTVVEALRFENKWIQAESFTDRPKRKENETGHHFISQAEFDELTDLVLPTTFNGFRYAMTNELLDMSDLIVVDPKGIKDVKADYHNKKVIVIGLYCDVNTLEKRMYKRGDSCGKVKERLQHDDQVFKGMEDLCDVMINNNGEFKTTINLIKSIIESYEQM